MLKYDRWEEHLRLCDEEDDDHAGGKGDVGIGVVHGRKSLSYYRLPDPLLKLSILKLDGSTFDVKIPNTATVLDLKMAVKDLFSQSPKEEGGQISWSHVWSHFCLSYQGLRLSDDKESLRNLRLKDGDQLRFVRHLSINKNPPLKQPKSYGTAIGKHKRSMTAPEVLQRIEENDIKKSGAKVSITQYADEMCSNSEENEALVGRKEFKLSRFLLKWIPCIRLQSSTRRLEGKHHSSRCATNRRRVTKDGMMLNR